MSEDRRRVALNTFLLGLCAALVVGTAVWFVSVGGDGPPDSRDVLDPASLSEVAANEALELIDFGNFRYDEDRLQEEWDEARTGLDEIEIGADESLLLDIYHDANRQAAEGDVSPSQLAALDELLTIAVEDYIEAHGPEAYQLLGWHVCHEFERAFFDLQERAREHNTGIAQLTDLPGAEGRTVRETVGQFIDFAIEMGIITSDGTLQNQASLLAVVFRYRWFKFNETYSPMSLMTPYERTVFMRWRIEAADGIPLPQRLAMINEAAEVYAGVVDLDALRASVHAREGNLATAVELLRAAAERNPDDPRYNAWASEVQEE